MAPGLWSDRISSLAETLRSRQMKSGGWAYFDSAQESFEATCLAELALAPERQVNSSAAIPFLLKSQLRGGGWPAFLGDSEGNWTTALALCTLNATGDFADAREKAFRWLYAERGREGHWFWRWKFKTADRNVRFDPDKYGWPWISGSASWYRVNSNAAFNRPSAVLRLKSLHGVAVVCLGADAGACHGVKTGGNAALLNRR